MFDAEYDALLGKGHAKASMQDASSQAKVPSTPSSFSQLLVLDY